MSSFKYLDAMLNEKCDDDEEVRIRVGHAKSTHEKSRTYLAYREVSMDLKMRMIKCYNWPVLLYGVEISSLKIRSISGWS